VTCGHHHDNVFDATACATLRRVSRELNCAAVVGLLESRDDQPRPTDCEACRRNYDLLTVALAVLEDAGGRC
jgi:hypothetical protein